MKKIKSHALTTLVLSGTIEEVLEQVKAVADHYSKDYTNLRIETDSNYEYDNTYYIHILFGDRIETDEEEALRIKSKEEQAERNLQYKREQYEKLKAEFEG